MGLLGFRSVITEDDIPLAHDANYYINNLRRRFNT